MVASAVVVVGATAVILLLSLVPAKRHGVRLSAWCFSWGVQLLMPALGLHFRCDEPDKILQHQGFVFVNHLSFFDTLVMAYLLPMRFLAKAEVRHWPFIGWIASATGTLYVDRNNRTARKEARHVVADALRANPYPPIVVFPEGTTNPYETLLPFRHGVFEIAVSAGIPYLLCAIVYERPDVVTWQSREEGLLTTVKRLVMHDGSRVRLIPLDVIESSPEDDAQQLAAQAREIVGAALKDAVGR
jgi:1-acyl-sn-glycerol-3-phosphate acyltransferase